MPPSDKSGRKAAGFVWVHNDEEVISKRQGSRINASARSHIMSEYLRKKNAARLEKLKDTSAIDSFMGRNIALNNEMTTTTTEVALRQARKKELRSSSGTTIDEGGENAANSTEEYQASSNLITEVGDSRIALSSNQGTDQNEEGRRDDLSNLQVGVYRQSPPEILYLNASSTDPFNASATPVGSWEHHLIHFFLDHLMPDVYGAKKESRDSLLARKSHQINFHHLLQDAGSLLSLLAASCANLEARQGVKPGYDTTISGVAVKSSFYYKLKLIQATRRAIEAIKNPATDIDDRLIGLLLGLLGTDWASGDHAGATVHIRAMCYLVKLRGGIHTLNARWAEDVVISDVSMAVSTISAPILPLTWTPVDLPDDTKLSVIPPSGSRLANLGQRMAEAQSSMILDIDLIATIQKLREITWISEHTNLLKDEEMRNRQWVSVATPAIEHRLLTFHRYHSHLSDQPTARSISITLILFTRSSLHYLNYHAEIYLLPLLRQLKWDLLTTDLQTLWSPFTDILLWVLCMGFYASIKCQDLSHTRWFERQICSALDFLLLKEWNEVESLLEEFFYLKKFHGEILRNVWDTSVLQNLMQAASSACLTSDTPPTSKDSNALPSTTGGESEATVNLLVGDVPPLVRHDFHDKNLDCPLTQSSLPVGKGACTSGNSLHLRASRSQEM